MPNDALVLGACWIAWAAYWWASSLGSKPDRRRESAASRASHMVPLFVTAFLLSQRTLHVPLLSARVVPLSTPVQVAGTLATAAGLLFSVWARVHLGRNWSATVTVKRGHELVQSGPYRIVRHPIYTGILIALLGTATARGDAQGFVAWAIACAAFWRKLRLEERWMQETFGEAYARYRGRVAALIPFLV